MKSETPIKLGSGSSLLGCHDLPTSEQVENTYIA